MCINNCKEYFDRKSGFLNQLLQLSEELLSNSGEFDLFVATLDQREQLIQELAKFENSYKKVFDNSILPGQVEELNRLVALILDLDAQTNALATYEKNKVSESIRTNINKQKFNKYASASNPTGGDLLNYKK